NLEDYAPPNTELPDLKGAESSSLPFPGRNEHYFKAYLPMSWVEKACRLPGRAWHLACALWFTAVCRGGRKSNLLLSQQTKKRFGLTSRTTVRRAVCSLRQARLVRVKQLPGQSPRFSILKVRRKAPG